MTIAYDLRGIYAALAFFLGLLALLAVVWAVNLRQEELGPLRLSRRTRLVGFATLAALYVATIYGWLFWRTFYRLEVPAAGDIVALTVLMPERELRFGRDDLTAVRRVAGSRAGFARLVVETRDGRRYRSPDRNTREIAAQFDRLRAPLTDLTETAGVRP